MQEGHVGGAQCCGHRGHALVARGADGIIALSRRLHRAAFPVERAGQAGRAEDRHGELVRQGACRRAARWIVAIGDAAEEVVVYDTGAVHAGSLE